MKYTNETFFLSKWGKILIPHAGWISAKIFGSFVD